jgi:hypothetical protein
LIVSCAHVSALALSLTLMFAGSPEPGEIEDPSTNPEQDPGIAEPSTEPPPPDQPPEGGFGSVTTVTTDSNVAVPAPTQPETDEDEGPRREMSLRAEIGYGQTSLGNTEGLDHQGMFLRAHFAFYPWLSKGRRVGGGLGLLYSYQGLNRKPLPAAAGFDKSKGQQQAILLSVPMLVRPHRDWFSIQPSVMIGLGFYTGGDLWAANRRSTIPRSEYAFVAGGDLALCTAWDIVCVVGGSEYFVGVESLAKDTTDTAGRVIAPWGWHVGIGLDVLRIIERGNRVG